MKNYNHRHFIIRDPGYVCDNPEERLLAAVVMRALRDYLVPTSGCKNGDREEAAAFIWSETGRDLLAYFLGISQRRAQYHLMSAKGRIRKMPNSRTPRR